GTLFVDRQVTLEFHENGTLKSFNGSSTGQGGKILAAAIKAASFFVTLTSGVPVAAGAVGIVPAAVPPGGIECKDEIVNL
ncbi:hypothetical protein ACX0FG_16330, partial [Enterococcus faecium]